MGFVIVDLFYTGPSNPEDHFWVTTVRVRVGRARVSRVGMVKFRYSYEVQFKRSL